MFSCFSRLRCIIRSEQAKPIATETLLEVMPVFFAVTLSLREGQLPHAADDIQLFDDSWNQITKETVLQC